jgi:hypothetical protein
VHLKEACTIWQSGRDGGSSVVRAAARALTGTPHYFHAQFIDEYQRRAEADPVMLDCARILLDAVADSHPHTASSWCAHTAVPMSDFAGRGLAAQSEDYQIREALDRGEIAMPLWGVSLGRNIALGYGRRFLLEITGRFHGVAAWHESGIKADQREIITGGRYAVEHVEDRDGTTHATLREIALIPARP